MPKIYAVSKKLEFPPSEHEEGIPNPGVWYSRRTIDAISELRSALVSFKLPAKPVKKM
jgi:ABC-type Zn uptake system ZnuABC Zn-binding protein ZnuA